MVNALTIIGFVNSKDSNEYLATDKARGMKKILTRDELITQIKLGNVSNIGYSEKSGRLKGKLHPIGVLPVFYLEEEPKLIQMHFKRTHSKLDEIDCITIICNFSATSLRDKSVTMIKNYCKDNVKIVKLDDKTISISANKSTLSKIISNTRMELPNDLHVFVTLDKCEFDECLNIFYNNLGKEYSKDLIKEFKTAEMRFLFTGNQELGYKEDRRKIILEGSTDVSDIIQKVNTNNKFSRQIESICEDRVICMLIELGVKIK